MRASHHQENDCTRRVGSGSVSVTGAVWLRVCVLSLVMVVMLSKRLRPIWKWTYKSPLEV